MYWTIYFEFDAQELGFLPNAFGFVWTDGSPNSRVTIELIDENFDVVASHQYAEVFGDDVYTGTTPEDRFLGVISDQGIRRVRITSSHSGDAPPLEIDHVQYGLVPEPSAMALFAVALFMAGCGARRSTRRRSA
ncbi:MAG: PEP-CTERM sorting domain-containing protein [Pirellulales bacterium]